MSGVSEKALQCRLGAARWQRILPAVYGLFSGSLTRRQHLIAAHLYVRGAGQITSLTALEFHRFRYARMDERVYLLVPQQCHIQSTGFVVVHRTARLDSKAWKAGVLRVCSPARAVADAARQSRSLREVTAMVAEAVQRGRATVAALREELEHGPRRGSRHLRAALADVGSGARSAPEAELKQLVARSAMLKAVRWNPPLVDARGRRLPTPDGYLDRARLAIEVDSKAHHTSPNDWERTMRRHNELGVHGILVLHFSPARIRSEPQAVLAEIEHAYLARTQPRTP